MAMVTLLAACGGTKKNEQRGSDAIPTTAATRIPAGTVAAGAKVNVVATTTQIQDFVRNVGGDRVAITGILKPNVDPHDYEPTVADADATSKATIIFVHGIGLDNWIAKTITNANAQSPVVAVTEGIAPIKGSAESPDGDPHLWFDPTLATRMVATIAGALGRVDSANAATYQANAQRYTAQIAQMDTQVQGIFDQVPKERRKLVTNHDAFRYLANHFGLTIVGAVIPSTSDTAEPTAKQINDLIATIKREQVKAIFAESSANPKVAAQVAQETGITIVDNLYGDTLGAPGSDGETYLKMMVADATTITNALK